MFSEKERALELIGDNVGSELYAQENFLENSTSSIAVGGRGGTYIFHLPRGPRRDREV